jgi:hypothetical protein
MRNAANSSSRHRYHCPDAIFSRSLTVKSPFPLIIFCNDIARTMSEPQDNGRAINPSEFNMKTMSHHANTGTGMGHRPEYVSKNAVNSG